MGRRPYLEIVELVGEAALIADFRAAADRSAALRVLLARHEQAVFAHAEQSAACNAAHSVEAGLLRAHDLCDERSLPVTQELLARK